LHTDDYDISYLLNSTDILITRSTSKQDLAYPWFQQRSFGNWAILVPFWFRFGLVWLGWKEWGLMAINQHGKYSLDGPRGLALSSTLLCSAGRRVRGEDEEDEGLAEKGKTWR